MCGLYYDSLYFSKKMVSNHPENSLEPELDKLLDNYYFGSYLEKNHATFTR